MPSLILETTYSIERNVGFNVYLMVGGPPNFHPSK